VKPVIALVGRPNVGKSTLFNRLTRSRDALVHDLPGVTRDRHYGNARFGERSFIAIDTGGFEPAAEGVFVEMARQAEQAIAEADAVILVVDGRAGLTPADTAIARKLRRLQTPRYLAVNKTEGMSSDTAVAEFHELGLGEPAAISAAHGEGVSELMEAVLSRFPEDEAAGHDDSDKGHPRVAIVGRPNVGKSTLVNALVGEERVIAFDQPGTTRDPIEVPFERAGRRYTLVDTAGLRRRGKTGTPVEYFSIVKALQAIEGANVAILLLDAATGITEQDAHVAGYILERGRAVVVAINKWDAADKAARAQIVSELQWKLGFLRFAEVREISAKEGKGLALLMRSVDGAYAAAMARLSTPKLTRALIAAVERHSPPKVGVIRPKLRYAHQGGINPPRVIIHGNAVDRVPDTYRRYLEGCFRDAFKLAGTPMSVEFRAGRNPYAGRGREKASRKRGKAR
jgi:GTP-binding protein